MLQQGCNRPPIHERMKRGEAMEGGQGFEIRKKSKTIDIEKKMSMMEKEQDNNQQHENDQAKTRIKKKL